MFFSKLRNEYFKLFFVAILFYVLLCSVIKHVCVMLCKESLQGLKLVWDN